MAITVKDIQEKEFPIQASNGYSIVEVDDFLDIIAEQLTALTRENMLLKSANTQLETDLAEKEKALQAAAAQTPDYNEAGYFQNLQSTMRETLISAQRYADETKNNAQEAANKILAEANTAAESLRAKAESEAESLIAKAKSEAETMTTRARNEVAAAQEQYNALKVNVETYRAKFRALLEEHMKTLSTSDIQFK